MKKFFFLFLSCVLFSCGTHSPSITDSKEEPSFPSSVIPSLPMDHSETQNDSPSKGLDHEDHTSGFGEFLD